MARPQSLYAMTGHANLARAVVLVFAAVAFVLPAQAQDAELQSRVRTSESDLDAAVAAHPAYQAVADGIAADCAGKLPDDAKISGFCRCATAVTFAIWRSKIDSGAMLENMNDYLRDPTDAGVAALLRNQGPSLYKSACEKVLGKS
jgi:hypothetical protein